jgi:hypothetical protein
MAAWVKCTDSHGRVIFLNMDAAITMVRLERTGLTRITFTGVEKDAVEVNEAADELIKAADIARR